MNIIGGSVRGDGGVAPDENDLAETVGEQEMGLRSSESQGMGFEHSLEDKSDAMEGDEEPGFATYNKLREDSHQTPPNLSSRCAMGRKHILMEIFALKLFEKVDPLGVDQIIDENIVLTTHHNQYDYILYEVSGDKSLKTNSEGHLNIQWPQCGIEIKDMVSISPYYEPTSSFKMSKTLWSRYCMSHYRSDCFTSEDFETKNSFIEVDFAVYTDGLKAKIDVALSDLELLGMPVYGTVITSNSAITHPQAKSLLFDQTACTGDVILGHPPTGEAEFSLPLSRSVTAIPRQSNLIVHINLGVGNTSIANGSAIFLAETRSNTIVEEQIIVGKHGKVKVKVTWVEDVDDAKEEEDGGSARGEEDWLVEEDEEDNDVENEGDEEPESEFVSDDDSSFQSLKRLRLNTLEDISTRSSGCGMKEDVMMNENDDGDQEASLGRMPPRRFKDNSFLEVFSVKFFGSENVRLDEIYGFILIGVASSPRLLFRRVRGDVSKINSQGIALLEGPRRVAWWVYDKVLIIPFVFKYQGFKFENEDICAQYLWHNDEYDKVLCKTLDNEVGQIEVKFAVYKDGVEARLFIMLMDSLFSSSEVYGTITATNLKLDDPRVSSIVFKKEKPKDVDACVGPRKDIALPLSRPIIALPHGSILELDFKISARGESINCPRFVCPVQPGPSEKKLPAKGCSVKIKVDFVYDQPREIGDYEGFF